jgi:hypothetical protein
MSMASQSTEPKVSEPPELKSARESLSQFVARVLDQLSVSAWLPSGAFVLGLVFIFQLLQARRMSPASGLAGDVSAAFQAMAQIGLSQIVLLLIAIIVLTIATQAFAFEAIRTLEGYWGTWRLVEYAAGKRSRRFANARRRLDDRYGELTRSAWQSARTALEALQRELETTSPRDAWITPNVLAIVGAAATAEEQPTKVRLNAREQEVRESLDWTTYATSELLRRRVNVDKKRRDYPQPSRSLPTRLGNILRAHEDETGEPDVEGFVQRVFDDLPKSMRDDHDDQRSRLDLYSSMVFVVGSVGLIAVAAIGPTDPVDAGWCAAVTILLMWIMYRAALSSARAYGFLLVSMARWVRNQSAPAPLNQPD